MEKIIYLIELQDQSCFDQIRSKVSGSISSEVEAAGGHIATLHTADLEGFISKACPTRQLGNVRSVSAVLSLWLPSSHLAEPVTEELQAISRGLHAYLVSEAVWQEDEQAVHGGQLRPGVNFVSCLKRNPALDDQAFYRHWDEHSADSALLHPQRQAYTRHTVVRPLTHDAPVFDGIVFEHFPSREVFADDQLFFDVDFAQETAEHTMQMIDLESLISNGFSQYQYCNFGQVARLSPLNSKEPLPP